MEYTIQQAKDEVAKKHNYFNWHSLYELGDIDTNQAIDEVAELYASKLREADRKRIEELTEVLESVIRLAPLLEYPDSAAESPYKSEAQAVHKMLQSCKSALNL